MNKKKDLSIIGLKSKNKKDRGFCWVCNDFYFNHSKQNQQKHKKKLKFWKREQKKIKKLWRGLFQVTKLQRLHIGYSMAF